jgi:hypothetical protein
MVGKCRRIYRNTGSKGHRKRERKGQSKGKIKYMDNEG